MERKYFVPVTKRVGLALAATALLAVGAACTSATQGESPPTGQVSAIETPALSEKNIIKTGQWIYMPGTKLESDGLHVMHRDFRIVQQDGSGGQLNPPVNEYGTYLEIAGDFMLQVGISDVKGPASLQLYEKPPIVSDEFRVEPKSIRFTLDADKLTVQRWDGNGENNLANQPSADKREYRVASAPEYLLVVTNNKGRLTLSVNGRRVGTFAADSTFDSGNVWIGADAGAQDGHFTVKNLEADGINGGKVATVDVSKLPPVNKRADGLQELASKRRSDFKIGADVALWAVADPTYRARIFGGDFGVLTPENALKWQFTEPQPGVYDFHEADAIVAEARKNNMSVHGHNLVFSEALPRWVQDLPTDTPEQKTHAKQVLIDHVTALVSHYAGIIDDWDINEIFADYGDNDEFTQLLRDNVFYRALGPDYVREVIMAARKANPDVRIWLNDYGMETDTGPRKQAADAFIKPLQQEGLIYGVGYQAHIYDTETDLIADENGQASELAADMQKKADDGTMTRVSELDAPADQNDYDVSSQSQQFSVTVKTCLLHSNCKAVSFWSVGITDLYQDNGRLQKGVDSMFDQAMKPTASYQAVQDVLRQ